jgi:hypothetical protein
MAEQSPMMTIDNPIGGHTEAVAIEASGVAEVQAPRDLAGAHVVLFGNNKPNVDLLFDELSSLLREQHRVAKTAVRNKLSAAFPAPLDVLDEVTAYQIAINGVGD